jgi:hypothetical protein
MKLFIVTKLLGKKNTIYYNIQYYLLRDQVEEPSCVNLHKLMDQMEQF